MKKPILLSGMLCGALLGGCTDKVNSSPSESASETGLESTTTATPTSSSTGTAEGSETGPVDSSGDPSPTTGGLEDTDTGAPNVPLTCPGARWVFTAPVAGAPAALAVDTRGHVLLTDLGEATWDVRHIDAMGGLVGTIAIVDRTADLVWGGVDAADHWYVAVNEPNGGSPLRSVRKFSGDGVLEYNQDISSDTIEDAKVLALAVAPNGMTVFTERGIHFNESTTRITKLDASAKMLFDWVSGDQLEILAMNDEGSLAAIKFIGQSGAVVLISPQQTELWVNPWWVQDARWAGIDANGEIILGAPSMLTHIAAARFATDGSVLWGHEIDPAGDPNDRFNDFAVNASGQIAIGAQAGALTSMYVAKLDAAGEVLAVHGCGPTQLESQVAIDAAGGVYLAGSAVVDGASVQFVAAFD